MRFPIVILLLLLSPLALAGHRVALIIDGNEALGQALESRGFVVTKPTDLSEKKIQEALHQFVRGIPTKGVSLIYTTRSKSLDRLSRMKEQSGALLTIILTEGIEINETPKVNHQMLVTSPKGFRSTLTKHLNNQKSDLLPALRSATREARGNLVTDTSTVEPPISRSVSPPHKAQPGQAAGDEWVNSLGFVFCWCPDKIGTGFWMGKYEVTMREFNLVTRKNPSRSVASLPNHPRDGIHYDDIRQFVKELNRRERFFKHIPENWEYALPSETQWLHACQAGSAAVGQAKPLHKHANFADASLFKTGDDLYHYADQTMDDGQGSLALVGSYPPNPWGLHDLCGNLWEWTSTFSPSPRDPKSEHPVACGGSWISLPHDCSPHARRHFEKRTERNFVGLRLVLQQR